MNEAEYKQRLKQRQIEELSDKLFAACLQFLIAKEEQFLVTIRDLSQQLLDAGYESNFEHRKRALVVRSLFTNLTLHLAAPEELDKLGPRREDLEGLPHVS